MKNSDELIDLRSIQQYLYCPHRWGLIETDCSFSENAFVSRGNLVHKNVDEGNCIVSRNAIAEHSVSVFNDDCGIYGIIDCLELRKKASGTYIEKYNDTFEITIVEYKPTAPKDKDYRYEDAMQLLSQKICADSIFNADCKTKFYYANTRKRVEISFKAEDYSFLKKTLAEMRRLKEKNIIPPKIKNQYCSGCSMKDICMPKKGTSK